MELLYKWFKSPVLMSCAVAMIILPCAWYTYALFHTMTKDESSSSYQYISQIRRLNLDAQLRQIDLNFLQLKTRLETLGLKDEIGIKGFLSTDNKDSSKVKYTWSSNQFDENTLLEPSIRQFTSSQSALSVEEIKPTNELIQARRLFKIQQEGRVFLGIQQAAYLQSEVSGYLFASVDLNELFGTEMDSCLQMKSEEGVVLFESESKRLPCDSETVLSQSMDYQINWFGQTFILTQFNAKSRISEKAVSLTNLLALLLMLMASLIIFYIYRSRRYELKIESLLQERGQCLKQVSTEYSKLFMLSVDGIYRASLNGDLLKANPAYALAFGYQDEDELCFQVNKIGDQLHRDPKQYAQFIEHLKQEKRVVGFEWQSVDIEGKSIWLLENAYLTRHENGEVYYEGFIADITEKKKAELALKNQAQMDSLTGLLNRATFVNQMTAFIDTYGASESAIFFIDLDKFKTVNDQYGHHVGDELLIEFSRRLKACFNHDEMISRLGGDEFAVYLKAVKDLPQLHDLADRVVAGLRKPFAFSNGCNFKMSASVGISMLDENVKNASEGLKQADMAMYEVKRNGRADFIIFNQGLNESERRRSLLEKKLFSALRLSEININYQPIVCFETGVVKGAEALMRWHNDEFGNVSPVEFIPIAEQINLINSFSNWLIHHVCHDLKHLIEITGNDALFVSINISPKQLLSDQVCDNLLMSLEVNQLKPKNIKLEITETAIYDQEDSVVKQLRRIRGYGIGIYIDDFGTGYSSLERLIQYPFDGLKIDRSFVKNLVPGNSQDVILKASVKMAEMLNLVVVVEGIESHFQYDFFKDLACEYAQGFLLYKPLTISQLTQLIAKETQHKQAKLIGESIN